MAPWRLDHQAKGWWRRAAKGSREVQMAVATAAAPGAAGFVRNRWTQLVVGIFTMVMIANLQYGWTLFVDPINEKTNFGRPFIVGLLSTFILFETWLVPFEAYLVDRFGPRLLVAIGGGLGRASSARDLF